VATLPCRAFADIAAAVGDGRAELGMLPVENSIAGGVAAAYDVLATAELRVVGEMLQPIRLCLLGVPGASLARLRRVMSHPVALGQCQQYLSGLPAVDAIAVHDTAGAARMAAERRDPETAAVAAGVAAARYGLIVLAENIQDRPDNQTRFYVIARADTHHAAAGEGPARTVLRVVTAHRPGALVDVLLPFAEAGINLTRLESRPATEPWHYCFFLELDADATEPAAAAAIARATARARELHTLGSFRRRPSIHPATVHPEPHPGAVRRSGRTEG
jgi:prephenate dehydratase